MSDVKAIPDGYTAITPYLVAEDAPGLHRLPQERLRRRRAPAHAHA